MIKQSNLAWINVSDFETAKTFFTKTLGLKINSITPEYNWMELQAPEGGFALGVGCDTSEKPVIKAGGNAIMTFSVDDIEKAHQEFSSKGVKFVGDIIEVPGHVKMIFFADPDGNMFQLVQKL